jgi:hypothetical protein
LGIDWREGEERSLLLTALRVHGKVTCLLGIYSEKADSESWLCRREGLRESQHKTLGLAALSVKVGGDSASEFAEQIFYKILGLLYIL